MRITVASPVASKHSNWPGMGQADFPRSTTACGAKISARHASQRDGIGQAGFLDYWQLGENTMHA